MIREQCGDCRFFERAGREPVGACRRYPPRELHTTDDHEITHWIRATVCDTEWCGEYQKVNMVGEK
jgi:hypothetical protein